MIYAAKIPAHEWQAEAQMIRNEIRIRFIRPAFVTSISAVWTIIASTTDAPGTDWFLSLPHIRRFVPFVFPLPHSTVGAGYASKDVVHTVVGELDRNERGRYHGTH